MRPSTRWALTPAIMRGIFFVALFISLSVYASAQESSCADGVDNDGDGFIDCFDGDCANNAACDDSYIGKDKLCQTPPSGSLLFGMRLGATSRDRTTLSYGRMVVGDLDRDGTPEMVTTHHNDKKVFILNGDDLTIKREINTTGNPEYFDHAIANLDNDNCAEIFIVESEVRGRSTYYMVTSFDCNGNQLWRTQAYDQPFTIGLADFDHDGQVELYYKNEILDAKTGEVLVAGKDNWNLLDSGPVAVDILPDGACGECAGLELVLGGEIYAVDLNPRTTGGGSVSTPIKRFNDLPGLGGIVYFPKYVSFGYVNSMTSIADYNLDGSLDVVMNGATSSSATSTTTVFFWDVANNAFKTFQPKQPNGTSWPHGTGRINLADVDGDGKMNATFVSGARIYSLKEDFTLLWQKTIQEQTSGFTSTTVFDFNNDNAVEIVYRDEANLYIIDGKTGNAFTTVTCRSRTANDYPLVVDVDADGATEICVSCSTNDNANIGNNSNTPFGQIRTFKSSLEPWVSARKVWNQYAYFNVNVNDDLTIPQVQQKHHLVFSEDVCGTGENRALNSFLNQSAILDSKGCKTYPSADVAFVANPSLLNVVPPTCPDKDFLVSFSLKNIGELNLNGDFPITFYSGDPTLAGAVKLGTEIIPLSNFKVGDQLDVTDMAVTGTGGNFTLFAVLNDNGSTVPTPINLPNSGFDECNFGNNIASVQVNPFAFQLTTSSADHVQCGIDPTTPNGSVRVFKPEGAVEQTVGYTFYWFDGRTAGPSASADHTGAQITGLAEGTYSVYALHDAFQCGSDTAQVVVGRQSISIDASVKVDHAYTNCNSPDGQLKVTPAKGHINDYSYEWFEGTVFGTSQPLSNNRILKSAKALTYSVLVTHIPSGCETLESGTVPDLTVTPLVNTAFVTANCTPLNSGEVSANVGGVTAGYTFYWYAGTTSKPSEDFLGDTYSDIPAGDYTVVAKDNTTGCSSSETVVTVPTASGITVAATATAQQTSCTTANGAASANVGGATAGYSFAWFQGNNTVNPIGNTALITGLSAGDYTVQATNNATGCVDTDLITIAEDIRIPTVSASVVAHQRACAPTDGAVSATAAGSTGPFNFYWFNGNIGTPDTTAYDFKGPSYTGLAAGFYTVVAVDANARCGSSRVLVQVLDQTVNPVITVSTVAQTSCDPTAPNGQASADVGGTTAGYKFRWFAGADTTNFLIANPLLNNRAAGTYTVKASDIATGCVSTRIVVINAVSAKPALSLVKQDNTICREDLGYTGSVTASFATNPNALPAHTLVYEWRKDGVVVSGQTSAQINGFNAGNYSVIVRNQTLGCVSDPVSIAVNDVVDLPTIATAQAPSTNCDPALANGEAQVIDVDGGGIGSPYIFQWHTGVNTTTQIAGATNAIVKNVQGGAGRNYTVLVTNQDNGCQNTETVLVQDNKALPTLALTPGDNDICDPSLTVPHRQFTGSVAAALDNQVGAIGDYIFTWYNGDAVNDPVNSTSTTQNLIQLNGGDYTATAFHTPTGCLSNPSTARVANVASLPVISTSQLPSTNCDPALANGKAQVTSVDGSGTGAPYVFQWYNGVSTTAQIAGATNATVENVQGGSGSNYTVLVTNQHSGCQNTATVLVQDNSELPVLGPLSKVDNTLCNGSNGEASIGTVTHQSVAVTSPYAGYALSWSNGSTSPVISSLPAATYSLTVTKTDVGCTSAPVSVIVNDNLTLPAIATGFIGSTNCSGLPNGSVTVTAPAVGAEYRWYAGTTAGLGALLNSAVTNPTATGLQGGAGRNYVTEVTLTATGCKNTATVLLPDNSALPVLGPLGKIDNTFCQGANGEASIGSVTYKSIAVADPYAGYTLSWSNGATTPTISGLTAATYSLTITKTDVGCSSVPVSVVVEDDLTIPSIAAASMSSTNCAGGMPNGGAIVTSVVPAGPYEYRWYAGNTVGSAGSEINSGLADPDIDGRQGGAGAFHTVEVTLQATGCKGATTVLISDASEKPLVSSLALIDNTNCSLPFNGAASIPAGSVTYRGNPVAAPYTTAGFALLWSNGSTAENISALGAGTYSLTITHIDDNCTSDPAPVTIVDDLTYPVVSTSVLNKQTSCDPNQTNGQLQATETSGSGIYTLDWFQGTSVGPIGTGLAEVAGFDGRTAPVLASDDYTVLVVNSNTRCETTATVFLPANIALPAALLAQTSNVTNCATPNGEITVTPTLTSVADGDFTIFYLKDNTTNPTAVKSNPATFTSNDDADFVRSNLGPGYFAVLVRDEITHCESNVVTIQIDDDTSPADITVNAITTATFCQMGTDGGIDINVTGGFAPYTFAWHVGGPVNSGPYDYINDEDGTTRPAFDPDAVPFPITTEDVHMVASGFYSVEVIDARGCGTVFSESVPFRDAPRIAVAKTNSSLCDVTNGDGSVSTQIVGSGNYSINLYNGLHLATATNIVSSLPFGADGIDNDGDGLTDASDSDFDAGGFPLCGDGIDNDGDLKIDTDDDDCDAGSLPVCTDGVDNDADGLTDSADPDCDGAFVSLNMNTGSLNPGNYLIEIVDHSITCKIYKTATVEVDPLDPVVTLGQIDPNTACDLTQADGRVELTVSKDPLDPRDPIATPLVYRIEAVSPAPLAGAFPMALSSGAASVTTTLNGFGAQSYNIIVTEASSGCSVERTVTIPSQPAVTNITVSVTDESLCAPLSNGQAHVAVSAGTVDNYQFTWYNDASLAAGSIVYQANGTGIAPFGGERLDATKPGYALEAAGQGAGAQSFYVRAQRLAGTGVGAGCNSPAVQVDIHDRQVAPTAVLTSTPNTSCDPLIGEGSISILTRTNTGGADPAVENSTYTYSINPSVSGPFAGANGALSKPFTNLTHNGGAPYIVSILNEANGCITSNSVSVLDTKFPIQISTPVVNDKLICFADGEIAVTEIVIDRTLTSQPNQTFNTPALLGGNFDFRWFKGSPGTFSSGAALNDNTPAIIDGEILTIGSGAGQYDDPAPSFGAGTYFVIARQTSGAGRSGANCETLPISVEIKDKSVEPVISLTPFTNTSCDPAVSEGEIEVDVTDASVVPGVYTYNYGWTVLSAGRVAPATAGNPYNGVDNMFTAIRDGDYRLSATNTVTGCTSTSQTTIQQNTTPIFLQHVDADAQLFCTPSGSLEVTAINFTDRSGATRNVTGAGLSDFSFRWFKDGTAAGNQIGSASGLLDSLAYATIGADPDYYVVATRTTNGPGRNCSSAPFRIAIPDERVFPVISLTPFTNTSCDPAVFEGEIEVDVTDASLVPGVYTYTYGWTALTAGRVAPATSGNPYHGVDNMFTALRDGDYRLSATNTVTGCTTTSQTTIRQNTTPIFLQHVDADAQLFCTPSGSLEVTAINFTDRTGATRNVTGSGLSDFSFTWFKDGTAAGNQIGSAGGLLDSLAYATIGADPDYYVVATRTTNGPGRNCSSAPFRVSIPDERVFPVIALTPFANTSCDPAVFEGEIEVDVTDASLVPGVYTYNYGWTALTTGRIAPATSGNPYNGLNNIFTAIRDGDYRLSATNTVTGCATTSQTTIQQNTTPIFLQHIDADAQLFCTPSGSLEVTAINFTDRTGAMRDVTGAGLSDFSFTWFKDGTAAGNQIGGTAGLLDSLAYATIGADPDYYVVATRTANGPGRYCSSAPYRIAIADERVYPTVSFNTTANTTCNNTTFDASITLAASSAGIGNGAGYSIVWDSAPGAPVRIADVANIVGPYTTPASDNIGVGSYTATVTNQVTQCPTTASVTILQNSPVLQILGVAKIDQRDCAPFDGSISIDTNDPGHINVSGSYTFSWIKNGIALSPVPDNSLAGLNAGSYTVVGTKTSGIGAGCSTSPFTVTLRDLTERPVLALKSQANFACDPAMANGGISAEILEGSAVVSPADYTLQWFAGKNVTSGAVLGIADVLANQAQGDYTLTAIDNVSPNRGCANVATLPIDFDATSFSLTVAANDQTICAPGQNGSVMVTGITEKRNNTSTAATNLSLYDYQWFDERGAAHPSTPGFTNGVTSINNLLTGRYQVRVMNALGCVSTETAALVNDQTALPVIALDNFLNPAVCVLPETSGYLQVSADNSLNFAAYTFEWFEGSDDSGAPVVANNATLDNITYNHPLEYTVRVTNIATNCANLDTYRFRVDTVQVQVVASAVGRTNCVTDDGSLFATTLDGTGSLYNYEWYAGPTATGTPLFTTKEVSGVAVGEYTVIAVNPSHTFCQSSPFTAEVMDERLLPDVVATQKNPLTYCDPANPNGVAFASVNNQVSGFRFDWFKGSVNEPPLYTGSEVTGLMATTYVVRATDAVTGCENTASILIANQPVDVPEPTVVVISHHTNCVDPDGVLAATVNGNTADYLLQWYNGNTVRSQVDEVGEFYKNLEDGFYVTTATDLESGCVSNPVVSEILPFREDPEFDIATVPTNCEQNIGEATLVPTNDVQLLSVEWNIDGDIQSGTMLSNLPKGEFTVTATTYKQCAETKTFTILPEVLVFNGISRNNDGQNDYFEIACIQDFPNNNVKIFNRAGTLVYEARGYNNQDVFFDGISNRGISLLGNDLPDGTYFYIIDKGDGSEPRTGYLELLK